MFDISTYLFNQNPAQNVNKFIGDGKLVAEIISSAYSVSVMKKPQFHSKQQSVNRLTVIFKDIPPAIYVHTTSNIFKTLFVLLILQQVRSLH